MGRVGLADGNLPPFLLDGLIDGPVVGTTVGLVAGINEGAVGCLRPCLLDGHLPPLPPDDLPSSSTS